MKDDIPFWVPFDGTNIPKNAVIGGEYKKQRIFIGRGHHRGSLTPGMILEQNKTLILPWGGASNVKSEDFEILCSNGSGNWIVAKNGAAPHNAFKGGFSEVRDEYLFIGRYYHEGSLVCGKIQPSHRVCYIAYEQLELNKNEYEVLVI